MKSIVLIIALFLLMVLLSLTGCSQEKPVPPSPIKDAPASLERIDKATGEMGPLLNGLRDDLRRIK